MEKEKAVVLIDAGNVYYGWKQFCKNNQLDYKLDYLKLINSLSKETNLLRAYFYDGVPENIPLKKKNFLEALQKEGVQLRTKILKNRNYTCTNCKYNDKRIIQKGVDVSLATDILRHSWQGTCDICIVLSGDEDYKDAIECAKDKGVKVWVASFKQSLSRELRNSADRVIYLDSLFDEVKREY